MVTERVPWLSSSLAVKWNALQNPQQVLAAQSKKHMKSVIDIFNILTRYTFLAHLDASGIYVAELPQPLKTNSGWTPPARGLEMLGTQRMWNGHFGFPKAFIKYLFREMMTSQEYGSNKQNMTEWRLNLFTVCILSFSQCFFDIVVFLRSQWSLNTCTATNKNSEQSKTFDFLPGCSFIKLYQHFIIFFFCSIEESNKGFGTTHIFRLNWYKWNSYGLCTREQPVWTSLVCWWSEVWCSGTLMSSAAGLLSEERLRFWADLREFTATYNACNSGSKPKVSSGTPICETVCTTKRKNEMVKFQSCICLGIEICHENGFCIHAWQHHCWQHH